MRTSGPKSGLHRGFASRDYGQVLHRSVRKSLDLSMAQDCLRAVIFQRAKWLRGENEASRIMRINLFHIQGFSNIALSSIIGIIDRHGMLHTAN